MVTVEWFGIQLQASWILVVGFAAVTFFLCAAVAVAIGKVTRLRVGALTMAFGGGAILFALVAAAGVWLGYSTLGSSQ